MKCVLCGTDSPQMVCSDECWDVILEIGKERAAETRAQVQALIAANEHQASKWQPRTCNVCGRTYRERWIYRRQGEPMCLECCEAIPYAPWITIVPGSAYGHSR